MEVLDKAGWNLGMLLMDPQKLFILWAIKTRFCVSMNDFRHHYGQDFPIAQLVDGLEQERFLQQNNGELALTEMGEQVVATVADTRQPVLQDEMISPTISYDAESFAQFIQPLWPKMYAICYRITKNRETAEDLAQDAIVKALSAFGRGERVRDPAAFLITLTKHRCIDWLRRQGRLGSLAEGAIDSFDSADREDAERWISSSIPDPKSINPELHLLERESEQLLMQSLERAIQGLSDEDRALLIMRYWVDSAYEEIGKIINKSKQTTRNRVLKALKNLSLSFFEEYNRLINSLEES